MHRSMRWMTVKGGVKQPQRFWARFLLSLLPLGQEEMILTLWLEEKRCSNHVILREYKTVSFGNKISKFFSLKVSWPRMTCTDLKDFNTSSFRRQMETRMRACTLLSTRPPFCHDYLFICKLNANGKPRSKTGHVTMFLFSTHSAELKINPLGRETTREKPIEKHGGRRSDEDRETFPAT